MGISRIAGLASLSARELNNGLANDHHRNSWLHSDHKGMIRFLRIAGLLARQPARRCSATDWALLPYCTAWRIALH